MSRGSGTQPSSTQFRAAFHRRLSDRDLHDLHRLTVALKAAGAPAFERFGVVVHLVHFSQGLPERRQADVPPHGVRGGVGRQGQPPPDASARTPRRQRRFERGAQRAAQRKERATSTSEAEKVRAAGASASAEPPGGTSMEHVEAASSVAAQAPASAATTVSTAKQLSHPQQLLQHPDPGEGRMLGLEQPTQAVREKRSAPSTPPRVHGERAHAEESGSPESVVPLPKRAHASSSSLAPPPSCVGTRNPSPTKELIGYPINSPDSDESDLDDTEKIFSDLISEPDRPIFAALKAASRGDSSAQSFLMDKYTRGELSPTMREMMEGMIEDG